MEALDSANEAFSNGTGAWPTMRVEERIKCVEKFAELMSAQKRRSREFHHVGNW